jgi:fructokinase
MFQIAGESLIDLVAKPDGSFLPVPGGAPYNFARALALQGLPAGYTNAFSSDAFGVLLKETLEASGATHLGRISGKPTSLALVTTEEAGHPRYSFYREGVADRDFDFAAPIGAVAAPLGAGPAAVAGFHTGALALVPPDEQRALVALRHFRARGVLCSVDVNMRPQVAQSLGVEPSRYQQAAMEVIAHADVVKVSDEDLRLLGYTGTPRDSAKALLARGCKLVVLTLGAYGAWALSPEHEVFEPAEKVPIADTVGAGDSFYAGFVSALSRHGALTDLHARLPSAEALRAALRHASVCAAINITREGCQPPTWEEALQWRPG